jgi:manganese efflux pump family protein
MIALLFHLLDDEIKALKDELMFSYEIFLLGLALSIDAAVVSFALSLIGLSLLGPHKILRGITVTFIFGLFQFLMLWGGSYGGYLFTFSSYGYLFQMMVAVVFFILAVKFFQESFEQKKRELNWGMVPLFILAFATSIDALAAGVSLGTMPLAHEAAFQVGIITSGMCGLFYLIGQFFQRIPEAWLLRFAGCILFFLSGIIILKHVH